LIDGRKFEENCKKRNKFCRWRKNKDQIGAADEFTFPPLFADVPNFEVDYIYPTAFSQNAVGIQMLQNFFNWFTTTTFWLTFLTFYRRLNPIFTPSHFLREDSKVFGDVPLFNATNIWQSTFSPEGVIVQVSFFTNKF
jgi:hypothetical protein